MKCYQVHVCTFILLLVCWQSCFSEIIKIKGNTYISQPTKYENAVLDLSQGYFTIVNRATLTIENCIIKGTISPNNPILLHALNGNLYLKNNTISVLSRDILPSPLNSTIYDVIRVDQGKVNLIKNTFKVDKPYTVGALVTGNYPTLGFNITNNTFRNMHGAIFLKNNKHSLIAYNKFSHISITSIFIENGYDELIKNNLILFSGNNTVGDGIDLIDSDQITLLKNYILDGSCYGIMLLRDKNILIENNKIIGGITYAITIQVAIGFEQPDFPFLQNLVTEKGKSAAYPNQNIILVNNYFSQNRYGLAASHVSGLIAKNNVFMQRFRDAESRKFWTNNKSLLKDVTNITWENNLYKESFSQELKADNSTSTKFIEFPLSGGVSL